MWSFSRECLSYWAGLLYFFSCFLIPSFSNWLYKEILTKKAFQSVLSQWSRFWYWICLHALVYPYSHSYEKAALVQKIWLKIFLLLFYFISSFQWTQHLLTSLTTLINIFLVASLHCFQSNVQPPLVLLCFAFSSLNHSYALFKMYHFPFLCNFMSFC